MMERKERRRGMGRGGEKNLKLSTWTEAVIFHPADFLPPVRGDRVERETIVAAV